MALWRHFSDELMTLDDRELLDIGLARADNGLIPSSLSTLHLMQVPLDTWQYQAQRSLSDARH